MGPTINPVNETMPELGRLLVLGREHGTWGTVASTAVGSLAAAAVSVGTNPDSPSSTFKYDPKVSNEDAACLTSHLEWTAMAVADAHYGPESSHMLIERLHTMWGKIRPTDLEHLAQMIEFLRQGDPAQTESETTLLTVVYERKTRTGFGISFGDSTFAIAGLGRSATPINSHDGRFVSARSRHSLRHGSAFKFSAEPGELLLAFTDGIDGCHYRSPATSVQTADIDHIAMQANYDPHKTIRTLTELALTGVRGNPGGEDNIVALAALA